MKRYVAVAVLVAVLAVVAIFASVQFSKTAAPGAPAASLKVEVLGPEELIVKGRRVVVHVKGFNVSDPKVEDNVVWLAKLLNHYVKEFTQKFNVSLSKPLNVTIVSPVLARKLGFPKTENPTRRHVLFTGDSLIVWWHSFKTRRDTMGILDPLLDAINMYYLFTDYVTGPPWRNKLLFIFTDNLNGYIRLKAMMNFDLPEEALRKLEARFKLPHEFTESMIEKGFYEPLPELLEKRDYRYDSFSNYGWEVWSFSWWLAETKGLSRYLMLLKRLEDKPSLEAFREAYGVSIDYLEREWLEWLRSRYGGASYESLAAALARADIIVCDPRIAEEEYLLSYVRGLAKYSKMLLCETYNYSITEVLVPEPANSSVLKSILENRSALILITTYSSKTYTQLLNLLRSSNVLEPLNAVNVSADTLIVALYLEEMNRDVVIVALNESMRGKESLAPSIKTLINGIPPYSLDPTIQGIAVRDNQVYILVMNAWFPRLPSKVGGMGADTS